MNDNVVRHLIALFVTLTAVVVYIAGYVAGSAGWWWAALSIGGVYGIVYVLVDL